MLASAPSHARISHRAPATCSLFAFSSRLSRLFASAAERAAAGWMLTPQQPSRGAAVPATL